MQNKHKAAIKEYHPRPERGPYGCRRFRDDVASGVQFSLPKQLLAIQPRLGVSPQ